MDARRRSLLLLTVTAGAAVAVTWAATRLTDITPLRTAVEALRGGGDAWWAVPLFVLLYTLCAVALVPAGILSAAAALTWGWKLGGMIELVTCTFAALVPWALARTRLAGWVERRIPVDRVGLDIPFVFLLLRIVPILPYSVVNYLAGVVRVPLRRYLLTTFAGSIPSVFLFTWFVDTMGEATLGAATQAKIAAACGAVAVAALIGRMAAMRLRRRLYAPRAVPRPDGGGLRSASPEPPQE